MRRLVAARLPGLRIPSSSLARPKSRIFTCPEGDRKILPGLMSRCRMPFLCAASSASATCDPKVQQLGVRHGAPVVELIQALPFQQLHHDERLVAAFVQFVNGADAGMVQGGGSACFAPETLQCRRVLAGGFGQELDGDRAAQLLVLGLIDHAHPTLAQTADNPDSGHEAYLHSVLAPNYHAGPCPLLAIFFRLNLLHGKFLCCRPGHRRPVPSRRVPRRCLPNLFW